MLHFNCNLNFKKKETETYIWNKKQICPFHTEIYKHTFKQHLSQRQKYKIKLQNFVKVIIKTWYYQNL